MVETNHTDKSGVGDINKPTENESIKNKSPKERETHGRTKERKTSDHNDEDDSCSQSTNNVEKKHSTKKTTSYRDKQSKGLQDGKNERKMSHSNDEDDSCSQSTITVEKKHRTKKTKSRRNKRHYHDKKQKRRRRKKYSDSSNISDTNTSSNDSKPIPRKIKHKKRRRHYSSSSNSSDTSTSNDHKPIPKPTKKVLNQRLLQKLSERGETLEEREHRREQRRAARIKAQFGYTSDDNPFNDPNLSSAFKWKKKDQQQAQQTNRKDTQAKAFLEIDKVRQRRKDYENYRTEMDRIRMEESRLNEREKYHEWEQKEEEFHLQQQRQRSAIRLIEGRERPIDVLAKNLLLFGLTEEEKKLRASVKYKERYNALDELETLEVELEEPHLFLRDLKLEELKDLLSDVEAFRMLEVGEGTNDNAIVNNCIVRFWDALRTVVLDEIRQLKSGESESNDTMNKKGTLPVIKEIRNMFEGQSMEELRTMKEGLRSRFSDTDFESIVSGGEYVMTNDDDVYWCTVLEQLQVHLAIEDLTDIHSKMLVCQLEKLEKRKDELGAVSSTMEHKDRNDVSRTNDKHSNVTTNPKNGVSNDINTPMDPDFGNLEEDLGLANEVDLSAVSYAWREKYRPRKPRYFNRVKTGYDWNKYNQTHYDHDNPPPKTVQGYKFNVFYPDLVDKTITPSWALEPVDTKGFCIIRFHAGPPYEDVAFKIINREWNRSRKRGFRSTFERGVLSLYFNFMSHWYRR